MLLNCNNKQTTTSTVTATTIARKKLDELGCKRDGKRRGKENDTKFNKQKVFSKNKQKIIKVFLQKIADEVLYYLLRCKRNKQEQREIYNFYAGTTDSAGRNLYKIQVRERESERKRIF